MAANVCDRRVLDERGSQKRLEWAGWGLLLVWIGASILAQVGWGIGLMGVGVIMLLTQLGKKYFGVKTDVCAFILGAFFLMGGFWELFTIQFSLAPVLCVVTGVALLVSALVGKTGN